MRSSVASAASVLALAALQHSADHQEARVVRKPRLGLVEQCCGLLELPVRLLQPDPAEPSLRHVRRGLQQFPVQRPGLVHAALQLQRPGQVRQQHWVAVAGQRQRSPVMELAVLRPVQLRQCHAEHVVRLRVLRRDPHSVARVHLGLGEVALRQQIQREVACCHEVVGIELDKAAQQCRHRGARPGGPAQPQQDPQRLRMPGVVLECVEACPLGSYGVTGIEHGHHRRHGGGRQGARWFQVAAPRTAEAGAARAKAWPRLSRQLAGTRMH